MAAAFCRATNDWIRDEWLNRDPRLRASIVIPAHNTELAVAEIERRADDFRFVQVMMLVSGEVTLGRRQLWPIYRLAEKLELPIGIHAGSAYHNPPTSVGWGSYHIEDYVAQAQAFQTQLTSLIVEGVFARHPNLRMVMLESGFTWLPSWLWRVHKYWRGLRMEIPWVDRPPPEIIRDQVRFTLQPIDAPGTANGKPEPQATFLPLSARSTLSRSISTVLPRSVATVCQSAACAVASAQPSATAISVGFNMACFLMTGLA